MTSLRAAAAACLLSALAPAAGAEVPDRRLGATPRADPSPTGYSCTVETLVSGAECVFEGDSAPPPAGAPVWSMKDAGGTMCTAAARPPGEARPDPGVRSACEADVVRSLERCASGQALLDAGGRFLPTARACYAALGNALARARTLAATVAPCCRCLAEARCGDARACVRGGLGQLLSGDEATCAARACGAACGPYLTPAEEEADDDGTPRKPAPGRPALPRFDTPATATKDL